jgi:hypothetical protein
LLVVEESAAASRVEASEGHRRGNAGVLEFGRLPVVPEQPNPDR